MRATRLMDYWKGADGYCRSYVLITKKYTLDDIITLWKRGCFVWMVSRGCSGGLRTKKGWRYSSLCL
ncbi:MAG TPA: hypothetical protein DCX57_11145 [Lachnospiraceae bacterium]|nr:hypothetical protein [Lachnospiraceae bacterium]